MDTVGFDPIMSIDEMAEGREAAKTAPDTAPDHSREPALDRESGGKSDPVCDFEVISTETEPAPVCDFDPILAESASDAALDATYSEPETATPAAPDVTYHEPEITTAELAAPDSVAVEPEPASDTVVVPVASGGDSSLSATADTPSSEPSAKPEWDGASVIIGHPDCESAAEAKPAEKPERPTPVLNKSELKRVKKLHLKNDNALIEARCYYDIRRIEMEVRLGDMSFAAKIDSARDRHIFRRRKRELGAAKDKLRTAKKYEAEDNSRYYRYLELDISRIIISKKVDRGELRELQERTLALLKRRDELNLRLTELYTATEGKGDLARGRFNAELKGRRAAYRRQLDSYRHYERVGISTDDKELIYPLMDERTVLHGELARIDYMLKREHPKGAAKRALKKQRRQAKRRLRENKRKLLRAEKRALGKIAENVERGSKAALGFILLILLVGAIVALVVFWPQIQPWFKDTLMPWLSEKFNLLVEWVTSLISGAGAEGGGE